MTAVSGPASWSGCAGVFGHLCNKSALEKVRAACMYLCDDDSRKPTSIEVVVAEKGWLRLIDIQLTLAWWMHTWGCAHARLGLCVGQFFYGANRGILKVQIDILFLKFPDF